jgi:hypothetical protein
MEFMAEKVMDCLKCTQFGDHACTVLRVVAKDGPFNDELSLASFLKKSEQKKDEDDGTYSSEEVSLWSEVATIWGLKEKFFGSYCEDYQILNNTFHEGKRTCWSDKYTTVIYNPDRMSDEDE